eukprot:jgi/Ulvmu1/2281/UM013_0128.1
MDKLRADWRRPGNLLQSDTNHTFINCSRSSASSHLAKFSPIQRARAVPDMGTMVAAASFTPLPALMGGACIGMLSSGKTLITGRILGISGAIKGLFGGDTSSWRALFLGGLLAGGGLVAWLMPGSIDVLPATFTFTRAIAAGLMVGAGAALGNGCTSGHGIAGNARLSLRSFVYTCVFFAAGIAVSIAAQTPDALGVARVQPPYAGLTSMQLTHGLGLVAAAATTTAVAGIAAKRTKSTLPSLAYEFTAGLLFALALGFSQMTRPTVVSTALAFFQPYWNWTLFFVMGGALAVAVPAFQLVILRRERALSGAAIGCPPSSAIDAQLLAGAVLFGSGWGLGGFCPGPALVSLGSPQPQSAALNAAMLVGIAAVVATQKWHAARQQQRRVADDSTGTTPIAGS